MKKTVAFLLFILALSCSDAGGDFIKMTGLDIGTDFTSLPISKLFTQVMDDEFFLKQYVVSDEIGSVSDLNVSTIKGKISEVKFKSNEETNVTELEKAFGKLMQKSTENDFENDRIRIRGYQTSDERIYLMILEEKSKKLKNGKPLYEYSFQSKEAIMQDTEIFKRMRTTK